MITIRAVSDQPCFICNSKDKAVVVQIDKDFRGTLCLNHVFEKLKPEVPRAATK
jgi:hypothetical protein